jgi:tRNA threonylcarbamoyladenosine biosynthesis protein TsaE
MTIVHRTCSEAETIAAAAQLARRLIGGDIVTLAGPLGAGKTCFVRGMAQGLGIDPAEVCSPTFVLWHEYTGPTVTLAHLDAYRLAAPEELAALGWDELLTAPDTIIAVEWPDRVAAVLPQHRIDVAIAPLDAASRRITIDIPAAIAERFPQPTDLRPNRCATCGTTIRPGAATTPFCSERCRAADLGRWFAGRYRISREAGLEEGGA